MMGRKGYYRNFLGINSDGESTDEESEDYSVTPQDSDQIESDDSDEIEDKVLFETKENLKLPSKSRLNKAS
jgi:hypothetical protein